MRRQVRNPDLCIRPAADLIHPTHAHRAHRIGQIRDVHIYRFVSQHTVEEALLRKANQKRSLDDLVIQRGAFDWSALLADTHTGALARALGEYEDAADAQAARVAEREELELEDEDAQDFEARAGGAEGPLVNGGGADAVGEKGGAQAEEVQVDGEVAEELAAAAWWHWSSFCQVAYSGQRFALAATLCRRPSRLPHCYYYYHWPRATVDPLRPSSILSLPSYASNHCIEQYQRFDSSTTSACLRILEH